MESPTGPAAAAERKRALRASARARRADGDPAERAGRGAAWTDGILSVADGIRVGTAAVYVAYGTEPPTARLIEALTARGVRILVPVLLEDRDLDWADHTAPTEPLGRGAITTADIVVVPALLAGLDGARLGQGGGSYDRALPRLRPGTPVVALVHDDEVVEAGVVPAEPHDVPLTHVVTPTRTLTLGDADDVPVDPELDGPPGLDVALAVAAGGALGSAARWAAGEALPHGRGDFPWATFVENVAGAFLLGVLAVALLRIWGAHRYARPFLAVGVLGGFTTFSTYAADVRQLADDGHAATGLLYLLLTLVVGLAAALAGLLTGRAALGRRR